LVIISTTFPNGICADLRCFIINKLLFSLGSEATGSDPVLESLSNDIIVGMKSSHSLIINVLVPKK
jgi:hypothetical protein